MGSESRFNSDIRASEIEKYCHLGRGERRLMEELYEELKLSVRAYHRILRVARTIADLAGEEQIQRQHLLEASMYRPSQEYWKGTL